MVLLDEEYSYNIPLEDGIFNCSENAQTKSMTAASRRQLKRPRSDNSPIPVETNIGKVLCYYKTASNRTSTTTYPTYANGIFNLNKSLRAGWTYYYCIVYGN